MFKKQKIDSSLYAVFDKSAGILREFTVGVTAGNACRDILLTLRVPLNDSELVKLGDFVRDVPVTSPAGSLRYGVNLRFIPCDKPEIIPWTVYKFPENVADAVAPLGCTPEEVREITLSHVKECDSSRKEAQKVVDSYYPNKEE